MKNNVKKLNNIAACFYITGDLQLSREYYSRGVKVNAISTQPDAVIVYNAALLEGELGGAEEDDGIIQLNALNECPIRNTLLFALQLKQTEFFSNSFYMNRRFNADFLKNQTVANVLAQTYEMLKEKKDGFQASKRVIFNKHIGNFGQILQRMVVANFIVCLVMNQNDLFLILWKTRNFCHYRSKRIRFLNRPPIMTSNIIAHRKDKSIILAFGIENRCLIYRYEEDLMELNKLKNDDRVSNIVKIVDDRTAHQAHLILENREIWKLELDTLQFKLVTLSERSVDQLQINLKFFCLLFDNKSLVIRNLETKKKHESLNATKVKIIQLIDLMNLLVLVNYRNEMTTVELVSNKAVMKKQLGTEINSVIVSKFHPLAIVYGNFGFVRIIQVVDGEFITTIGPFSSISVCFYDEDIECLAVVTDENMVKLFRLSMKEIGHKKPAHNMLKPVIMHNFESEDKLNIQSTSTNEGHLKAELSKIVKAFLRTKEVKELITLERNFENLKAKIDLSQHFDLLLMMRKVNQLKYKNGVDKISFNLVFEEFSYCQLIENKFDNIVSCAAISNHRRFMAISSRNGPIAVYSLATFVQLHLFKDVCLDH